MTDGANVVTFQPRHQEAPATELTSCELRLDRETFALELTVLDGEGGVAGILSYSLDGKSPGFDLNRLADAWSRWRQASSIVA